MCFIVDLYYGGESVSSDQHQSYTCPHCGRLGFTDLLLLEHVGNEHADATAEVVIFIIYVLLHISSLYLWLFRMCDPTTRQPGFDLPRQQWSLLNRLEQGHCSACRRKWRLTDTDLCPCGKTQMMFHIVEYCPLTKLNGGLSRLHSADEDAVSWLTSYGKWHAYEKKKTARWWIYNLTITQSVS